MDKLDMDLVKKNIAPRFRLEGTLTEAVPYGSGHINDTVRLTCELENGKTRRYILQRMNDDIFKNPKGLMENIMNVTSFLRNKIIQNGGDPDRETLNVIRTVDGDNYLVDEDGDFWRMYILLKMPPALISWKNPKTSITAHFPSAISRSFWQIILRQHCMKRYPISTIP